MNSNKYIQKTDENKQLVRKSYSITFNSELAIALNPDTFNNKFQVTLNNGLGVPSASKSCEVALVQAQVWNYDSNIRPPNNKLYYKPNAIDPATSITIPEGYYGVDELNSQIKIQLQLNGDETDTFSFTGDVATQKIVAHFGYDGVYLDFTQPDTLREILGFNSRYSPATAPGVPASTGDIDLADNVAAFNSVNAFLIECGGIVNDGININQIGTSIVGQVPITAGPNSLISFSPEQAIWIDCEHLIGANRTDIQFTLKNELLQDVTVLDAFNWTITIRWSE